jgi:GNAT superfamily N-acetyltransferase
VILLWRRDEPVGVCVFCTPAAGSRQRARYFGTRGTLTGDALAALNGQLWVLARVVLHPTWRGAGVATAFVRRACELCPVPWVEALAAMGHVNPFFERAGFRRVGVVRGGRRSREPVYYVFDNRR